VGEDPVWGNNLFVYGNNNPLSNIDINGRQYVEAAQTAYAALMESAPAIEAGWSDLEGTVSNWANALKAATVTATVARVSSQIRVLSQRLSSKDGIVYSLRATHNGDYPDVTTGGEMYLKANDVWKYGETTNPGSRYSAAEYATGAGLEMQKEAGPCGQFMCKAIEKGFILEYYIINGRKPPGNSYFR
jgi:hypothetical protein